MTYRTLTEAADAIPGIRAVLLSGSGHLSAAQEIKDSFGYSTSEKSVRRWRSERHLEIGTEPFADDPELAEDIGNGMDLGDEENVTVPGWSGFQEDDRAGLHSKLDTALAAVNANPDDVAGLRVSQYQTITKDKAGDAHVHDLYAVKLLVRTKDVTPEWLLIQPATPTVVHAVKSSGHKRSGEQVAVILPDPQIGYRFFIDDQTFDPFHDEAAMNVALQVVRDVSPDMVIHLGDFQDFPAFSRYEQEQAFAATTQRGLDRGHQFLAEVKAVAPDARQVVMEGNHDKRLQTMIVNNALAAFGLKRAGSVDKWPVLSLPYLLRFEELGVEYIEGYPAGQFWLNDHLRIIHGLKVRSSQSTASAVVHDDDVSTIFGHIHRVETQYLTRQNRNGAKTLVAHSPGCLCRIDGAVPSVKGSTDLTGRPVESFENWQQGMSIVRFEPGDGSFAIESLFIDTRNGHKVRFGGKVYSPDV